MNECIRCSCVSLVCTSSEVWPGECGSWFRKKSLSRVKLQIRLFRRYTTSVFPQCWILLWNCVCLTGNLDVNDWKLLGHETYDTRHDRICCLWRHCASTGCLQISVRVSKFGSTMRWKVIYTFSLFFAQIKNRIILKN